MERSDQELKFEYTDARVAPGVTYFYKLDAVGAIGKSHFAAKASATPLAMSSPDESHGQSSPVE